MVCKVEQDSEQVEEAFVATLPPGYAGMSARKRSNGNAAVTSHHGRPTTNHGRAPDGPLPPAWALGWPDRCAAQRLGSQRHSDDCGPAFQTGCQSGERSYTFGVNVTRSGAEPSGAIVHRSENWNKRGPFVREKTMRVPSGDQAG
jgi:hypothetical protein